MPYHKKLCGIISTFYLLNILFMESSGLPVSGQYHAKLF